MALNTRTFSVLLCFVIFVSSVNAAFYSKVSGSAPGGFGCTSSTTPADVRIFFLVYLSLLSSQFVRDAWTFRQLLYFVGAILIQETKRYPLLQGKRVWAREAKKSVINKISIDTITVPAPGAEARAQIPTQTLDPTRRSREPPTMKRPALFGLPALSTAEVSAK